MDLKRAREIANSPVLANVSLNGVPIYIENVVNDNTAMVHPLNNPTNLKKVSLSDLIEG